MNPVSFALILHAHQPIGNFDHVIEGCYQQSYLPFLECLERHPGVAVNLHYSGSLLEWIERHHPDYLARVSRLWNAGRVEMMGGGFYEPILIAIPERDRLAQITRLRDYIRTRFGEVPRGAWLAERVWEPELPKSLAEGGVKYTLLDDTHFLSAGADPEDLYGYYATEYDGHAVDIIPGLKSLRYLIPWKPVTDVLMLLGRVSDSHPNALVAMGDDLEKFGSWPGTYDWVYKERWLDNFFSALEANRSWVQSVRAGEYLESHAPIGRIYLPTASYREMTEWWLPQSASEIYIETIDRLQGQNNGERCLRFVNAGSWRNFLSKYSESNLLHKQIMVTSKRFHGLKANGSAALKKEAYTHLLAAQCNDAYWHGVFGGLYAPHLRHELYCHLIKAEAALEKIEKTFEQQPVRSSHFDLTLNGRPELQVSSERVNFLIRPCDGATVAAIHYKPSAANLVNSLRRRPEVYHRKVAQAVAQAAGQTASIHDRVAAKEGGLDRYLIYDRYDRTAFRNYLFPTNKMFEDFQSLRLEESPAWAAAEYALAENGDADWLFVRSGPLNAANGGMQLLIEKRFRLEPKKNLDRFTCLLRVKCFQGSGSFCLGVEVILNLLAGNAPDRYYSAPGWKQPLDWAGELCRLDPLSLTDEWLKVSAQLTAQPSAKFWWLAPIYSVSQSEEGFEKVYQGSAIMPVWNLDLKTSDTWEGSVELALRSME